MLLLGHFPYGESGFYICFYFKGGLTNGLGKLHIISTGQQTPETLASIVEKIGPFVDRIHLRERIWSDRAMVHTMELLQSKGVPGHKIIVNSRLDVAHVMQAGGVQLTHHSMELSMVRDAYCDLTIGCSVHDVEEAVLAEERGADYLLYGHVFESKSKPGVKPRGLDALKQVAQNVSIPVIAIGGIKPENTKEVIRCGASGIAVLSGVLLANDPVKQAILYRDALRKVANDEKTT
ncbi:MULTISPECIES: thiamine phosphate synthase [Bacillaceae]|uniref:thiamine phosphate synthase n=1 Tax=Bacillaceae TaxID=186817 RepID=UPI0009F8D8A2|nr:MULTISPECIES: thiamine phosphate synthase [Bacillaceae]